MVRGHNHNSLGIRMLSTLKNSRFCAFACTVGSPFSTQLGVDSATDKVNLVILSTKCIGKSVMTWYSTENRQNGQTNANINILTSCDLFPNLQNGIGSESGAAPLGREEGDREERNTQGPLQARPRWGPGPGPYINAVGKVIAFFSYSVI